MERALHLHQKPQWNHPCGPNYAFHKFYKLHKWGRRGKNINMFNSNARWPCLHPWLHPPREFHRHGVHPLPHPHGDQQHALSDHHQEHRRQQEVQQQAEAWPEHRHDTCGHRGCLCLLQYLPDHHQSLWGRKFLKNIFCTVCFLRYFILQYTGILRKTGQNGKFIGPNMRGFLQFFPIQVFHDVGLFSPSLGPELECKHCHLWMEGCQVQRTFVKTPKLAILF